MSEVPYLFFTLLAMFLLKKSLARPESKMLFWLTIIASVAPINCRSIGLAFSLAWIISCIWSGHYRYAVMHAVMLILTISIFRSFVPSDPYLVHLFMRNSYEPEAGFVTTGEMWTRILENIARYSGVIVRSSLVPFAHPFPAFLNGLFSTICIGGILIGWIRSFFMPGLRFAGIYLLLYAGILCMWQQQWAGERFLVCVVPFLFLFLLYGLDTLATCFDINGNGGKNGFFKKLAEARFFPVSGCARNAIWIVSAVILLFNLDYGIVNSGTNKKPSADWRNYYSCADWIRLHTPADAIVMSRKPELFFIRSGH
jgi:hypothetical protein